MPHSRERVSTQSDNERDVSGFFFSPILSHAISISRGLHAPASAPAEHGPIAEINPGSVTLSSTYNNTTELARSSTVRNQTPPLQSEPEYWRSKSRASFRVHVLVFTLRPGCEHNGTMMKHLRELEGARFVSTPLTGFAYADHESTSKD